MHYRVGDTIIKIKILLSNVPIVECILSRYMYVVHKKYLFFFLGQRIDISSYIFQITARRIRSNAI